MPFLRATAAAPSLAFLLLSLRPLFTSPKGKQESLRLPIGNSSACSTYLVTSPIQPYYYTQLIGDAKNLPTLLAASNFAGMAIIDADPTEGGKSWYVNQNNL